MDIMVRVMVDTKRTIRIPTKFIKISFTKIQLT